MAPVSPPADAAPPRIIAIIGSPRKKGNTYRATQVLEEQVHSRCGGVFEYLFLADLELGLCRGCSVCLKTGEDRCPLRDVMPDIEQQLLGAHGVVFACPVYVDNMPWLMKNFLDRLAYANHRPRFFEQATVLLSVSGGMDPTATLRRLAVVRHCGFRIVDSVGILAPAVAPIAEVLQGYEQRIQRAARTFCDALGGKALPAPSLEDIVTFRAKQALFSILPEVYKADYQYWGERGWLDPARRYYIETPIPWAKETIARLMVSRMRRALLKQASRATSSTPPAN